MAGVGFWHGTADLGLAWPRLFFLSQRAGVPDIVILVDFKTRVGHWDGPPCPKRSNGTPGKKPPAPSVKRRPGRTPLEQRSGNKPAPTVHNETNNVEAGRRPKPVSVRRGRGRMRGAAARPAITSIRSSFVRLL
jgi:hypothetical protein